MNNHTDILINGWVASSAGRGSIDILWSCCVTIVLCCWVAVLPNVGAPTDKWYHPFRDKFNLACIAILGPDLIFGIAWGQFSSARRSVKLFKENSRLELNMKKWTLRHAFFVDMGGIHLKSPDFPDGFPINAEQFHYLVVHNHIDFPNMEDMDISERNSADNLSRIITIFQTFWFIVSEIERVSLGLPMTTLELTTISFSMMMFATSITWYHKPSISRPRCIHTRDGRTVQAIRDCAQRYTHPALPARWYQTPLEFIGHDRFAIAVHWGYYTQVAEILHIPLFSRPVTSRPWDRFRSDSWLCPDFTYTPIASLVLLGFSILFIPAWNFRFPTNTERILWRVCSVYHAFFSIFGGIYFLIEMYRTRRHSSPSLRRRSQPSEGHYSQRQQSEDSETKTRNCLRTILGKLGKLGKLRNISPDHDPEMGVPLRVLGPVSIICILYVFCRGYFYVEDFISMRSQPSGVYIGVNKFIPFLGS